MKRSLFYLMLLCAILVTTINSKEDPEEEEEEYEEEEYKDDYYDKNPNPNMLLHYENQRINDTFVYKYIIRDGTSHDVKGTIKDVDGKKLITAKGEYRWNLEKGVKLIVLYEADENGFRIIKTETIIGDRVINPKAVESILG